MCLYVLLYILYFLHFIYINVLYIYILYYILYIYIIFIYYESYSVGVPQFVKTGVPGTRLKRLFIQEGSITSLDWSSS